MYKKLLVTNIHWDATNKAISENYLPSQVELTLRVEEDTDLDNAISERLSEIYGFTVKGFCYKK